MSLRLREMGVDGELGLGMVEGVCGLEGWEMGVSGRGYLENGSTSPHLFARECEDELL